MGKGGGSPNVSGAAAVEGEYGAQATRDANYANRPDQFNPMGSLTWQQENVLDPASGEYTTKWTQRQNLSADMQNLYDNQMSGLLDRSALSGGMMNRVASEMGPAPDWEQFGGVEGMKYNPTDLRNRAEDASYGRATSRLDPQFAERAEANEIALRNKGLRPGDQAYDAAMNTFNRGRNDAYEQARMGATGEGRAEAGQLWNQEVQGNQISNALRDKQIQEYIGKRQFSLSESNALSSADEMSKLAGIYGA